MKKLNIYLLSVFILLLAACGNNEEPSTEEATVTEGEDNSELTELEEENEELRRQLEEQDEEDGDEEVVVEETGEDGTNAETGGSEDTQSSEEVGKQDDNTEGDRSDLVFDINSSEVQSQLMGTNSDNDEGNFEQDAINIGMSQTEVEDMYGEYDFSFYYQGAAPAFYENLAVVYSELEPYDPGDGGGASMNDINPNENIVEAVYYYAGITPGEMIQALGEPDEEDDGNRSMNGLPYYIYEGGR